MTVANSLLIFSQIGKLSADTFLPPGFFQKISLVSAGLRSCTAYYQKHCNSFSGLLCLVDTFRNQSNRTFGGRFTICRTWIFEHEYHPNLNQKRERKSWAYPKLYNSKPSAASHPKNIHRFFPVYHWGKAASLVNWGL